MSLYQYLIDYENFTEAEASETVTRYDNAMYIPYEVKCAIDNYRRYLRSKGVNV